MAIKVALLAYRRALNEDTKKEATATGQPLADAPLSGPPQQGPFPVTTITPVIRLDHTTIEKDLEECIDELSSIVVLT